MLIAISFAFFIKEGGVKSGVTILLAILAPMIVYSIATNAKFGIIILISLPFFINWILRMNLTSFPLGTVMDGLQALLILGMFIRQKYEPDWSIFKSPISIMIIVWIAYNFLQFINPTAESRLAWLYTIRSVAIVMLTYFIFSYNIRSVSFIRLIIKIWLGLSFFAACYAFKQQHIGFFGFEEAYLYSDPIIMDLLFIGGEWRKFSIFSDPVTFSYNMIIASILCLGLMFGPVSRAKKVILFFLICFFLMNMLYSGTRSAFILFPAALILLVILVFNKKMVFFAGVATVFIMFLIYVPTSNLALYRFQTAFKPSNDASFNVRAINQKRIQPFIQTHPLGGGLGSTGIWGVKFSPGSFLASFPPDSGYVRVAVELGWLGLLLFCILMFIILKTGINNYYLIKDPELKSYCLAMVLIVFAINIGNYPQEALVQFPANIYFYLITALINITYRIDKEYQEKIHMPEDKVLH